MALRWMCPAISLFIIHFLIPVLSQNPIFDPRDNNAGVNKFYLTSRSDCGDEMKNIYNYEAVVEGYELNDVGTGPTTCTIILTSSSVYEGVQLKIMMTSVNIRDCRTKLSVYDGQGTNLIGSYDCKTVTRPNLRLVTTGDTVKFTLSRPTADSHNFDIQMTVKAFRSDSPDRPGDDYYEFQKFDQDAIVGMIGGLYALVFIICISVVCYCNVKYRGLNKKWETHQLETMKTDTSFEARSQVSQPPWSVGAPSQRGPTSHYSRSYTEPYSRKGNAARSEDGSSVVYDHDEKFQQRNLMNEDRDRYRDRDRMASQNSVCSDDDDPDNFKEKVITPRVKTAGRWRPKDQRPPSFEEATRERSSSEEESEEETEESSDADSTRKRLTTSSEEETSESETESESEESSLNSERGARARKSKNSNKRKGKGKGKTKKRRESLSDDASSQRTEPRRRQPKATQPPPFQSGVPYGAYPPPGGQFVPVMAGPPPQFQPVQMIPPNYPPPPHYPVGPSHPVTSHSNVQPTDPPVYSYLVRRGYTPLDAHNANGGSNNSPAGSANSSQRNGPTQREEPDMPLQSGVEYMRR